MGLKEYQQKRDFEHTTEPRGKIKDSKSSRLYVIQKHAASRLHYDFRLEIGGVLKSWAIPKGPSLNPAEKHLAVHVEDHPLEYGEFEGVIPEDEYGGGTVMLWDQGEWHSQEDPLKAYKKGRLKFLLKGKKLEGSWLLAKMGAKAGGKNDNWLLIKIKDEFADSKTDILTEKPFSAASGRSIEEIAADRDRLWSVDSGEDDNTLPKNFVKKVNFDQENLQAIPGSRRNSFFQKITPQLATLVIAPPEGDNWLHEIKYDGYRMIGFKEDKKVTLISRNGKNWTDRFFSVEKSIVDLPVENLIIDGEIVVRKKDGTTDFQALQNVLKGISSGKITYYAFDLLYLNGFDLTGGALLDRKRLLADMLQDSPPQSVIKFSDHIRGKGKDVYLNACRYALEGIVSKKIDGIYHQQRTSEWLKIKCLHRQEFIITGYTNPSGARPGFGALLLGYYNSSGELTYAGRVGTGFNEKTLRQLGRELEDIRRNTPSLPNPPRGREIKGVNWVEPEKVAEIEFSEWTDEERLRQPSFKGIREDKEPRQVVREKAKENSASQKSKASYGGKIAGIKLSNPDKVLYPDLNLTKEALAGFYQQIAHHFLPYLIDRPLTIVRCPQGRQEKCFYQKHLTEQFSDSIKGIPIREKNEERLYIRIENLSGLIALVQLDTLEFHTWGSKINDLERPDIMIFDMDPGSGLDHSELVEGCLLLKEELKDLGLKSFIKTSGGKGYHILVPLVPENGWDEVKAFSGAISRKLAHKQPKKFIDVMTKSKRKNKIFVDYLRNGRGATNVAPFSTRARPGASVSTPISWDELDRNIRPDTYNVENLLPRLEALTKDPWEDFFKVFNKLPYR